MNIAQSLALTSLLLLSLPAFAQRPATARFHGDAPDSLTIACDSTKMPGRPSRGGLVQVDTFSSSYGEPKQLKATVDQACQAGESRILVHVSPTGRLVKWVAIR